MPRAYLDANVYNDVERDEIPAGEVAAFLAARKRGEISARLSVDDLEESLGLWHENRATALRRLRIAQDLAGFEDLLKQPLMFSRRRFEHTRPVAKIQGARIAPSLFDCWTANGTIAVRDGRQHRPRTPPTCRSAAAAPRSSRRP